jgi:NADPH:quinone reductase-like Zn-dependent oxidoreductase
MSSLQFQVRRSALTDTRVVTLPDVPLADGQVRVRVALFAFTANNITYAAFGEAMQYWQFYPVPDDADGTAWGNIPVWGFAEVVQSLHPGVAVGERLYGYWPMASHAVLQPTRLTAGGFSDGAPQRAALHPVYNQVMRCSADPFYSADTEALQALLRPLFMTAWLIDDFLADNQFFGAQTLLLSAASSKTAYATAAQLAQRPGVQVIALTSAGNRAFCESLGCYHRVLTYDELAQVPAEQPVVYVDFAGSAGLRAAVHGRFSALAYSCAIGGAHVNDLGGSPRDLPGPKATLFFAPAQAKKLSAEWGGAVFNQRLLAAWQAFVAQVQNPAAPWLVVQAHHGAEAATAVYQQVLGGRGDARTGHIVSLS